MRSAEEKGVTARELEMLLERHECRVDAWGTDDGLLAELRPEDGVMVVVSGPDGEVVFDDIVAAEDVWDTFDFLAVLFNGGLLP